MTGYLSKKSIKIRSTWSDRSNNDSRNEMVSRNAIIRVTYTAIDRTRLRTPANESASQITRISIWSRYTKVTPVARSDTLGCTLRVRSPVSCQRFPSDSFVGEKIPEYRRHFAGTSLTSE